MSQTSSFLVAVTDQLHATGIVLPALESGSIEMDAGDYKDMAACAADELSSLDAE